MARKWTRSHEQQMKRILGLMTAEARPFADNSRSARDARKNRPFDDWCRTYFPHYFTCPSAPFHHQVDDQVNEKGMPNIFCWFRGAGKSVRYGMAHKVWQILNRRIHFSIIGARDEEAAVNLMDFVRLELNGNQRLRQDYGDKIGTSGPENDWVACGARLWARGIGQSVRGARYRQWRPDDFYGDDLDNEIISRSPKRVKNLWEWLMSGVLPALEEAGQGATFNIMCNMYGRGCLATLARDLTERTDSTGKPLARFVAVAAVDEHGHSTWIERYSDEALARTCIQMGPRYWRSQMLCKEDDPDATFRPEWIQQFTAATFPRHRARVVAYCDPSAGSGDQHDFKAWIVLARLEGDERIYCLHAWIRHAAPNEMLEEAFRIYKTYAPGRMACEANGFQALIWPLLAIEEARRNVRLPFSPVTNTTNKADRVLSNQPEFNRGLALFDPNEGDQKILIEQFLDFGKTTVHDDGPDAWDGARRLLPSVRPGQITKYRGVARESFEALCA